MNSKQLMCVVEIAKCGSVNEAARVLNIPQQTVSNALKTLENELQIQVFERGRVMTLTEEGEELYNFAKFFYEKLEKITVDNEKKDNTFVANEAEIWVLNNIAITIMPNLIKKLNQTAPNVKLSVREKSTDEIIQGLSDNKIKLGVILLPQKKYTEEIKIMKEKPKIVFHPLFHCKPIFWCGEKNPFAERKRVDLEEIAQCPLIFNSASDKQLFNIIFKSILEKNATKIAMETSNVFLIAQLVYETTAVCPDIMYKNNVCGYENLFTDDNKHLLCLSKKDDYDISVGYVAIEDSEDCIKDLIVENLKKVINEMKFN